jgi:hypothetical protein
LLYKLKGDYLMKKPANKNSYVLRRMFAIFALSVAGVVLLTGFENLFHNGSTVGMGLSILRALPYVGAAITVLGLALFAVRRIRGVSEKELAITSWLIVGIGLFVTLSGLLMGRFFPDIMSVIYVMLGALMVLYLIAYIYQREFFVCSILVFGATFSFYAIYRFSQGAAAISGRPLALVIIIAAVCLAFAALCGFSLRKKNGLIIFGQKEFRILPRFFEYKYVYMTLALIILGLIFSLLIGFRGAYYMMFAMLLLELAYAIYFTARLM